MLSAKVPARDRWSKRALPWPGAAGIALTKLLYARINGLMDASVFGIALYDESEETLDYALFIEESQSIKPLVQSVDSVDCSRNY